ncbi:hypothetical protein [Granulicella sibirica]|uniref:PE_PGRS family protein n=1 Tax=Granulicella sibirica TaxID=2479048 RepID=A0A4Q0T5A6_9BACT|nr:hypothetical protein [Granulicella sibirica]RXH56796.1 PE_PGRS family protein [Granulicella sibirica]
MKHLAVAALVFAGITLPVCAQRGGGGHGSGFAGHSSGAMRGTSGISGARSFSPSPGYSGSRIASANRPGYSGSALRRGYSNGNRFRRPNGGGYGIGIPYVIPIWGSWADPGALGYGDNGYDSNGSPDPNANAYVDPNAYGDPNAGAAYPAYPAYQDGYAPGQPDQGQMPPPGPYAVPYQPLLPPVATLPQQPLRDEEPVTLVFRDGRPTQQIHNYALTRTTLVVMDGRRREIPLAQLDIPETERINREAGVEFTTLGVNR